MAAAGGFDISQFEQMILALLSPDNNIRNQAEEALRQAKQNPEILLPAYVQLLRTNQNPQVRSMCAVLLRKSVMQAGTSEAGEASSSLAKLSVQAKHVVKSELLACIEAETERHIRKKICDAVGQLGVNVLTEDIAAWPELMPFMLQATRSGNPSMHEAALIIFSALSEFIAEKLKACSPPATAGTAAGASLPTRAPLRSAGTTPHCSTSSGCLCRLTSRCWYALRRSRRWRASCSPWSRRRSATRSRSSCRACCRPSPTPSPRARSRSAVTRSRCALAAPCTTPRTPRAPSVRTTERTSDLGVLK